MSATCDFCGARGGMDLTVAPARYLRQGRRHQGAMTPLCRDSAAAA